ncbi:hypothetical protein [Streptomyces sp. NPDC002851]
MHRATLVGVRRRQHRDPAAVGGQSRAVATRYDKRGYVFLGTTTAAAIVIGLRI